MSLRSRLKRGLLASLDRLSGRHAVLLPAAARDEARILDAIAPYRVEGGSLEVALREPTPGALTVTVLGYEGHFPRRVLWRSPPLPCRGPTTLWLGLEGPDAGLVRLGDREVGRAALPEGRRLALHLELHGDDGSRRERTTGHYRARAAAAGAIDERYFHGDAYLDHEAQGEAPRVVDLLARHHASGPILEVGCATGGLLAALDGRWPGASVGVDASAWAVERAAARLGPGRAFRCEVEHDELPAEVVARAPFSTLVLWAVLEHFAAPFATLERLGARCGPGALLVINTANADGLGRFLFGRDWEGHYDYTHAGVEQVGVRSLRAELPRLGWQIEALATEQVWDASPEETHASVREAWQGDARFRRLLVERDLGDFITCVARRAR